MADPAAELIRPSADEGLMEFEQPLNERLRTFLRIEFLYQQALFHALSPMDFGARAAVASLLEIMTILARGDTRAEVLKELEHQTEILARYQKQPGVDLARLQGLIDNVVALRATLSDVGTSFMNPLKECDFLNTIKHRSAIPGGTCMFDLPDYGYWLRLPHEQRASQFQVWTDTLRPVCDAVAEVLWLTREATEPTEQIAESGMYQHSLDRNEHQNLLRVLLPPNAGLYPEISAGKHRFTVRFVEWKGIDARPAQTSQDVRFLLALC